jgi:hypothetical protein
MFMQTVQKNVFLILNRVPVTFVTDPELIRLSISYMTHPLIGSESYGQKGEGKKVHG